MAQFIGRQVEIARLRKAKEKKIASFVLVKGRRRIGKSRLIDEFGKEFDHYYRFTGIPPTPTTTGQHQLDEFSRQLAKNFNAPLAKYDDWSNALWAVAERVTSGKILLLFDEISWMGSRDPNFLGKIKNLWDQHLKKNDNLVFIICGSASAWIEKNILSNTGFVGRISFTIVLQELSLADCARFWPKKIAAFEKLKLLSITGGVPRYLEEANTQLSAEENVKTLCFTEGGLLVNEFEQIFSDIFLHESLFYLKIVTALAKGSKDQTAIQEVLKLDAPGRVPEYLWELELAGFIARDYTWDIKSGCDSKLSRYRLKDNYLRFYLKYIEKNMTKIKRGNFTFKSLGLLPEWHAIAGLQFENLVLNNRLEIHQSLGLSADEIVSENPFFQRTTARTPGCQIDYLIQTRFQNLYVCEIKFSKNKIGAEVISSVKRKIDSLRMPKGFSCRPVLIHAGEVSEEVIGSDYFANVIDMSTFMS